MADVGKNIILQNTAIFAIIILKLQAIINFGKRLKLL